MAGHVRLQDLTTLTGPGTFVQELDAVIDVGELRHLVVEVRCAAAADLGSTVTIQHAPCPEADAFADLCGNVLLSRTGNTCRVFTDPLRFLRWKADLAGGSATFLIDVIGRGGC